MINDSRTATRVLTVTRTRFVSDRWDSTITRGASKTRTPTSTVGNFYGGGETTATKRIISTTTSTAKPLATIRGSLTYPNGSAALINQDLLFLYYTNATSSRLLSRDVIVNNVGTFSQIKVDSEGNFALLTTTVIPNLQLIVVAFVRPGQPIAYITLDMRGNAMVSLVYNPDVPPCGTALGCYVERTTPVRDMPNYMFKMGAMSIGWCTKQCSEAGYEYAALSGGSLCYCASGQYGRYSFSTSCNQKCSGNANEICGGAGANSVFHVGNCMEKKVGLFR